MTEKRVMWEGANGVANRVVLVDLSGDPVAPGGGGGGGGGSSDTTEATQLLVKAAVQSLDTKTPTLESGRVPVVLPAGLATQATAATALAELEAIDAKTPALVNTRTPVDTDRVTKQLIDNASATVTYVCEAATVSTATSAAAWRIKRVTVAGNVTTIQWGGTGAFDQIADNRATTVVYA